MLEILEDMIFVCHNKQRSSNINFIVQWFQKEEDDGYITLLLLYYDEWNES